MNNYRFGNYISELREAKGLSQTQLADILGVTNKAVSKWENGAAYPSSKLIYPLAKTLGVSVEEMYRVMSESEKPKSKMRKLLDAIYCNHGILPIIIPIAVAVVMYVVFAIFGDMPDKSFLLISAPILAVIVFFGFFLVLYIQVKNPMCPEWFLNFAELLVTCIWGISAIVLIITFLLDVKEGFSDAMIVALSALSSVAFTHKKRH